MTHSAHHSDALTVCVLHSHPFHLTVSRDRDVARPAQVGGAQPFPAGIVIAGSVHDGNTHLIQSGELLQNEALRLKREPLVVKQVARDEHGVHTFSERQVGETLKREARRIAQPSPHGGRPTRQGRV